MSETETQHKPRRSHVFAGWALVAFAVIVLGVGIAYVIRYGQFELLVVGVIVATLTGAVIAQARYIGELEHDAADAEAEAEAPTPAHV